MGDHESPAAGERPRTHGRAWRVARRLLAGFFALTWLVFPGFGLIDLTVTWDPDWPQVLEAGWGMYMTALVGVPFVLVAAGRCRSAAALQLLVAAAALALAAVAAAEWALLAWAAVLAAETLLVAGLPRRRPASPPRAWQVLGGLLAVGAVPGLLYALAMWDLNRQDRVDKDVTVGIDHYSVQGALPVAVLALVLVATLHPGVRLLAGVCAGACVAYTGVVSWAWHPTPGSVDQFWSGSAVVWGAAVIVAALLTAPRHRRSVRR